MNKNTIRKQIRNKLIEYYSCYLGIGKKIEKKLLFVSFDGKQYSCNPRAISERMHELYPEYEIVWYLKTADKYDVVPNYVRTVTTRKGFLKEMVTSFCVVTNKQFEEGTYKRNKQFFVQTWHGDIGIKKILYDAWEDLANIKNKPVPIKDNELTDVCIAGSDLAEEVYRSAFRYKGFVLKEGTPRNDKLCRDNSVLSRKIKKIFNIGEKTKIVLFAPTFRDRKGKKQESFVDLKRVLSVLNSKTGENWICLYRAHVGFELNITPSESIINVSDYPDMADLLAICDMLITDYSACAGDFLLRKKAVVLAIFDYEEYLDSCRTLKIDPVKAGFLFAFNQEELERLLANLTEKQILINCESLMNRFKIVFNPDSSKVICDIIDKEYKKIFCR